LARNWGARRAGNSLSPWTSTASTEAQAADRLAQRPGGKQPAIAEAALAIDYCDLDVARQTIVLKPVVADNHIAAGVGGEECQRGLCPISAGENRHATALRQEHRFVARTRRIAVWPHLLKTLRSTVAA
jgi:hypothetical protein